MCSALFVIAIANLNEGVVVRMARSFTVMCAHISDCRTMQFQWSNLNQQVCSQGTNSIHSIAHQYCNSVQSQYGRLNLTACVEKKTVNYTIFKHMKCPSYWGASQNTKLLILNLMFSFAKGTSGCYGNPFTILCCIYQWELCT